MASNFFDDDFVLPGDEQEGGTDATSTGVSSSAIDSLGKDSILDSAISIEQTGAPAMVPVSEQLGSMLARFGQSIAAGTGDIAGAAALSRENVDNPDYMIKNNLDFAHMSPTEQAEVARKMEGQSPEEQIKTRKAEYAKKRESFIEAAQKFQEWMPEVEAKKTSGVLGVLDDAMTGMARFAPTMVGGALTGGAASMPLAYMQILPGKFEEYSKDGLDKDRAFRTAQGASIALAAVEAMGTNIQLSKLGGAFGKKAMGKGFKKFIDQVVSNGVTEGVEELTQGEIEVLFDVYAKNPEATPEEMGKKVVEIWKDPVFQKEKLYEAGIGFIGGSAMGGGAAVASEVTQRIGAKAAKVGDGEFIVENDKKETEETTDVRDATNKRPTVDQLIGETQEAVDMEADLEAGVAFSENLTVSPEQMEQEVQTTEALKDVLDTMQLDTVMKREKIEVDNNVRKLDTISGLYSEAVISENTEEAMALAEHYAATVKDTDTRLGKMLNTKSRKLAKDEAVLKPEEVQAVDMFRQEKAKQAHNMVSSAVQNLKAEEAIEAMNLTDALQDPTSLQTALVKQERQVKANNPEQAKTNRKITDMIEIRKFQAPKTFLSSTVKMDKLVNIKGDLERQLVDQKEDKRASSTDQVVTQSSLDYVNSTIAEKQEFDETQAEKERVDAKRALLRQDATRQPAPADTKKKAATEAEKRQAAVKKETARKAELAQAKKKREETPKKVTELSKRVKATVAERAKEKEDKKQTAPEVKGKVKAKQPAQIATTSAQPVASKKGKKPTVKDIKEDTKSEYTILTSDNPNSTPATPAQNVKARAALKKKLDDMGVDYEVGASMFEGTKEVPFVIRGMSKAQAKELSDSLGQTSFIQAKGDKISLVEGASDNQIKRSDLRVAPDATDYFTKIGGKKFTLPFFTEKSQNIDASEAQKATNEDTVFVGDFKKMTLEGQMGTLEAVDSLKEQMTAGKYSFLFNETAKGKIKTVFVTDKGQYGKMDMVKKVYPNLKRREEAIGNFDGRLKLDPKTGQMNPAGGSKGVYLKDVKTALINLPLVNKSASNLDQAMETVAHEHIHGLVDLNLDDMTHGEIESFRKDLDDFWESVPQLFRDSQRDAPEVHPRIRTGITQIDEHRPELVTYALAHPEFAEWLESIPASENFKKKNSKIKTMWDALVDMIVKKVLGMPSKHDEIQAILNKHLKFGQANVARFSKEDTSFDFGANVTPSSVKLWTSELDNQAENAIPTTVVDNADAAKEVVGFEVDKNVASIWVPEHTMNVFDGTIGKKGKTVKKTIPAQVVIIADNITSQEHLTSKWMHEQVGHQGLRNTFGENNALLKRFLDQSYAMFLSQDGDVLAEIQDLYNIGKVDNRGNRKLTKVDKRLAAEEMIARRSEVLKPKVKTGLINKFKNFVKRWLPKSFIGKRQTFKMTDSDVMNILEMSKASVMHGDTLAGTTLQKALDARAPKHAFKGWKTLPNFMFKDAEYIKWVEEVEAAAPQVRKWYDKHQDTLHGTFGPDADLFNILLSVTSPQADVNTNVIFAAQTYAYMMGLTEKPGALFANKLKKRIDENWNTTEEMFKDLESKNYKVTEFVRGLNGDPNATVGDLWMFRAFFGDGAVYNKEAESYSQPQIVAMRQKIIDLASQMSQKTGETYTPREVQAAIWIHINAKTNGIGFDEVADYQTGFNKPSAKFNGKSPLEWLNSLVTNLSDGPLSQKIGISKVPMAPISPLAKQRLTQVRNELREQGLKVDKFTVDQEGTISVKATTEDEIILNTMDAIVEGGTRIVVPSEAADWYRQIFGFREVSTDAGQTTMALSEAALNVFKNEKGKVTLPEVRNNLGGFSGTYTQSARFSREATDALNKIENIDDVDVNAEFMRTGNDGQSVLGKVHEWRDQSKLNMDRFTVGLEQELLDTFNVGRKVAKHIRGLRVGSGRLLNTSESEQLQKAMNLYADSGLDPNRRAKVEEYAKELAAKEKAKTITNKERKQLQTMSRMLRMTEAEMAWVDENIRGYYEDFFKFANEHQMIDPDAHIDGYVKRQWNIDKKFKDADIVWNGTGTSGFKLVPSSAKQRSRLPNGELKIDSIVDGWRAGLDLKTEGVIGNLSAYGTELGYTYANRKFVDYFRGLIGWNADSIMFEQNMKTSPDFKPPTGYAQVHLQGMAKPFHKLFARSDVAKELNKMGTTASALWELPGFKGFRRINSMIKSTILSVSMFHHLAGMRSYVFGVSGKGKKLNPITAYKRGLAKIDEKDGFTDPNYKHLGPIVDMLVREGLTLGATQDWDEAAIQESYLADQLEKGTGKTSFAVLKAWEAARRAKRSLTTGLFNRLFAGLKAEAGSIELMHKIKQQEKKLGRALTESEMKLTAQKTARLVNADFGGLHLGRMGRHPDLQRVLQGILLAPDWTESNWRTVTGMVPGLNRGIDKLFGGTKGPEGMAKTYRRFWGGILVRSVLTSLMANMGVQLLLAGAGDDEAWDDWMEFQKEQWTWKNWFKGRWTDLDVTGVYKLMGINDPSKRHVISVAGHFKDILKIRHPVELAKHKAAPVPARGLEMITGTDWKGAHFTTWDRMIQDGTLKLVEDTSFEGQKGSVDWLNAGSFVLYSLRQTNPIPVSNMLQAYAGESELLSAGLRSVGLDTRDVRRQPVAQTKFEEAATEINELDRNLKEAQAIGDQRMIFEARRDIGRYKGYNRTKARIGFTKAQIAQQNRKLKAIKAKEKKGIDLTEKEERKVQEVNEKKQAIYEKAIKVLDR